MRLLFVIPSVEWGAGRALMTLLGYYVRSGQSPTVVTFKQIDESAIEIPQGVKVVTIDRRSAWSFPLLVYRVALCIRRERPDVVIGWSTTANLCVLLAQRLLRNRPAIVLTEHDRSEDLMRLGTPAAAVRRSLVKSMYASAARIIAVSDCVKNGLHANLSVPAEKISVIHPGLDIAGLRARAGFENLDRPMRPRIVTVSRLDRWKDVATIISAFALVGKSADVTLTIVGDGPERDALEYLATSLGVAQSVHFTGFLVNAAPIVASSSVFVSASRSDSWGVALTEAMALGVPVVAASDSGGPDEILSGGAGILVPQRDAAAMSAAVLRVLGDARLAAELSQRASDRCRSFDISHVGPAYDRVFEEICLERRPMGPPSR